MTSPQKYADDISYIRGLVDRHRHDHASIWWLWAVLVPVGFGLMDVRQDWVPVYWMIAGPGGGILSAWLGYRASRDVGEVSREDGVRWMAHFAGLIGAVVLAVAVAGMGFYPFEALDGIIVLIIAAFYYTAGIHLNRRMIWAAGAIALTFPLVAALPSYGWTASGLVVGAAFATLALVARRA